MLVRDLETGRRVSRQDLLVFLLQSLEREAIGLLDPAAGATIPARIERASTWIRGRRVEVHLNAQALGVDHRGADLTNTGSSHLAPDPDLCPGPCPLTKLPSLELAQWKRIGKHGVEDRHEDTPLFRIGGAVNHVLKDLANLGIRGSVANSAGI